MNGKKVVVFAVLCALALSSCWNRGHYVIPATRLGVVVARDGATETAIVIPKDASDAIKLLAADLQGYFRKISDVELPVLIPERIQDKHKCVIALGLPEIKQALAEETGEFAPEEFALKSCDYAGRRTMAVVGGSDLAVQYGAYAMLEIFFGVRFFHPQQEFVPKNPSPFIGRHKYWRDKPRFAVRGMEPQLMEPFSEFRWIFTDPQNVGLAKKYVDYLVKNRQNVLALVLPAGAESAEGKFAAHLAEIFAYARMRGIKVMLRVAWNKNPDVWPVLALQGGAAAIPDTKYVGARIERLSALGADIVDIDMTRGDGGFRGLTASDNKAFADALKYLKGRGCGVRIFCRAFSNKGESPEGTGVTVNIGLCRDLVAPFRTPGGMYTDSRPMFDAIRVSSASRPVIFSPASSAGMGCGLSLPMPNPLYIYLRYGDMEKLSLLPVEGQVCRTCGLEWLSWLNDYAAMRYSWDPERWNYRAVLRDYAVIFGEEARPVVERELLRTILALRRMQMQRSLDEYLWFWTLTCGPLKSAGDVTRKMPTTTYFRQHLIALDWDMVRASRSIGKCGKTVPEEARVWFDELADTAELSADNARLTGLAIAGWEAAGANQLTPEFAGKMRAVSAAARKVYEKRTRAYRYPGGMYGSTGGYLEWLEFLWSRVLKGT